MGIVLTSVVAATLIFVQIYRNAMEQSAVTSSSQSCEQVQNTVENYTQDMRIILEGIVARRWGASALLEQRAEAERELSHCSEYRNGR